MHKIGIDSYGQEYKYYYNYKSEFHREDGPAVEYFNGDREWWVEGKRHRIGGPAVIRFNYEGWYQNNISHREGGPAVKYPNGDIEWCINGQLHREDGPAVELVNGGRRWYYHGKNIECNSQEEFLRIIKMKTFW